MIGQTALLAGLLFASGVYLILSRNLQRVAIGFIIFANAANFVVLASSGLPEEGVAPLLAKEEDEENEHQAKGLAEEEDSPLYTDPLPQAFILTAIVIGLGHTALLLALAARTHRETETDELMFGSGFESQEDRP
ncbi:Na(+)/H(+) antiporter subunit C [soil metagenome]